VGSGGAPETGGDAPAWNVTLKLGVACVGIPLRSALRGGMFGFVAVSVLGGKEPEAEPATGAAVAALAELDPDEDDADDADEDELEDAATNAAADDWRARSAWSRCARLRWSGSEWAAAARGWRRRRARPRVALVAILLECRKE
jgi:hypothetical protein